MASGIVTQIFRQQLFLQKLWILEARILGGIKIWYTPPEIDGWNMLEPFFATGEGKIMYQTYQTSTFGLSCETFVEESPGSKH